MTYSGADSGGGPVSPEAELSVGACSMAAALDDFRFRSGVFFVFLDTGARFPFSFPPVENVKKYLDWI